MAFVRASLREKIAHGLLKLAPSRLRGPPASVEYNDDRTHVVVPYGMAFDTRLLLPLTWMAGIFALSSIPDTTHPASLPEQVLHWVSPGLQNLLHVPLYFGLAMAWLWALEKRLAPAPRMAVTAVVTGLWALLDEYHQLFVPGRFGSWTDVALDELGLLAALMVAARRERISINHIRDADS